MEKDIQYQKKQTKLSKERKQINKSFNHDTYNQYHSSYTRKASQYGIQFKSQVYLFERGHCKSLIEQVKFDSLSTKDIFNKVYSFVNSLIIDPKIQQEITLNYRVLNSQMNLLVRRSKNAVQNNSISSYINKNQQIQNKSAQKRSIKDLFIGFRNENQDHISLELIKSSSSSNKKYNPIQMADIINEINLNSQLKQTSDIQSIDSTKSIIENNLNLLNYEAENNIKFDSQQQVNKQDKQDSWIKLPAKKKQRKNKISIILMEDSECGSDSAFFSQQETISISQLAPSNFPLSLELVQVIFQSPSPLFVNLTVCLLLKLLSNSQVTLNSQNAGWILCISTVVAFKIFYDEPIEGLIECFSQILGIEPSRVVRLQRWFLQELSYEVVISSRQYQDIMFRLLKQKQLF